MPAHRFTPTHVGKTRRLTNFAMGIPVHPHARGEDEQPPENMSSPSGSPPRTWGRLRSAQKQAGEFRLTPTHVGKTDGRSLGRQVQRFTPTHVGKTPPTAFA